MTDDDTTGLRRELHRVLTDLDALPRDAFAERAPLQARADELRAAIRRSTVDDQVVRDAEVARVNRQGRDAQGMPRLQADLGALLDRIAAAERHLEQRR